MDKRDLLDRLAANGDERLLLGRVWDKYEQCRRRNIPVVTGFLSPAEQELVRRLMGALDVREGWLLWGWLRYRSAAAGPLPAGLADGTGLRGRGRSAGHLL